MRLLPKILGDRQRIDVARLPPGHFIAGLMQLPVMAAAERHRELIADFETDCSGLGKAQVMRIAGCRPQTRHGCEATNFRCALSRSRLGSAMVELALVDPAGTEIERCRRQRRGCCGVDLHLAWSFGKNSFIELVWRRP